MLGKMLESLRKLRRSRGYTLVELAAVTAIAAGVTAAILPIAQQQISKAKKAQAIEEAKQLATAVMRFWADTGSLPNDADFDPNSPGFDQKVYVLYTGSWNDKPALDGTDWAVVSAQYRASIRGYLLVNDPDTDSSNDNDSQSTYPHWGGPYVGEAEEEVALDPWGHSYLIQVESGLDPGTDDPTDSDFKYAIFVISAGPDGVISTTRRQLLEDQFVVGGDDIVVRIR